MFEGLPHIGSFKKGPTYLSAALTLNLTKNELLQKSGQTGALKVLVSLLEAQGLSQPTLYLLAVGTDNMYI